MPEQLLPICDITYLIAGNARYTINGTDHELGEGDLLCLPANTVRAAITYPDRLMHCFSVNFFLRNMSGKSASLPFPVVSHIGNRGDMVHLFQELDFTWLDKQPGYTIKARGLLLLILHRLFEILLYNRDFSTEDNRIKKIIYYIANHYYEKITVQKMAEMVGLNAVYLGALFKQETGISINQYVTKIRINNAESMLKSGEYTVEETGEQCGFSDHFYFYKQFQTLLGFSPS
jgi:AraC-like DNA-binding protein